MNENELVKKVLNIQQISSCKNDWILQLKADLKHCQINLSENEIKIMKKNVAKRTYKQYLPYEQ